MNLTTFLRKTDNLLNELSEVQKTEFVHEIARTLPENKRESFLDTMYKIKNNSQLETEEEKKSIKESREYKQLILELNQNECELKNINAGQLYLDSEYNEEWDDWYNPDVEEILFSDPFQLLPMIKNSIVLVHKCIDLEVYAEGLELAETLAALEVTATGDYADYDGSPLGISELYEHGLLDGSFETFVQECLFLAYVGNELQNRAEEMFLMISDFRAIYSVRLEDILQNRNLELPELDKFLPLWIDYLGQQYGTGAARLLEEAQSLVEDDYQMLENARKYSKEHPELYLQILKKNQSEEKVPEMMHTGLEALETIPKEADVRSEIALYTAFYANQEKQEGVRDYCWMTAFESEPTIVNYMRIRFLSESWQQYKKKVLEICDQVFQKDKTTGAMLYFWNEKFDDAIRFGMNIKDPLGWSFTFMKDGIAAFLLLLFEGDVLPNGLTEILFRLREECGFSKKKICFGMDKFSEYNDTELFWKLFVEWKTGLQIEEEEKHKWLQKMKDFITFRVDGIMKANKRKYYGECAVFIAALGEVYESLDEGVTKKDIMSVYRDKYSRRWAFVGDLKKFYSFL